MAQTFSNAFSKHLKMVSVQLCTLAHFFSIPYSKKKLRTFFRKKTPLAKFSKKSVFNTYLYFSRRTFPTKSEILYRRIIWMSKRLKQEILSSIGIKICEVANEAIKFSWQISIKMRDLKKEILLLNFKHSIWIKYQWKQGGSFRIIIWKTLGCKSAEKNFENYDDPMKRTLGRLRFRPLNKQEYKN